MVFSSSFVMIKSAETDGALSDFSIICPVKWPSDKMNLDSLV